MYKALGTLLILVTVYSATATAEVAWAEYPGYFKPGSNGIVVTDLDGDGTKESVVSGSSTRIFEPLAPRFLAVLKHSPAGGYRTTHISVLDAGEVFEGQIFSVTAATGAGNRIVATVEDENRIRYLTTFGGPTLERLSKINVGQFVLQDIADLDGDGDLEAIGVNFPVSTSTNGQLQIRDLATGALEFFDDSRPAYRVAVGQLDQDTQLEIVYGTQQFSSMGYVVDSATFQTEWLWMPGFAGTPVFGNFDNNPATREFAVIERWGTTRVYASTPAYSLLTEFVTGEIQAIAVRDMNADGIDDLVMGQGQWGDVLAYNPTNWFTVFRYNNPDHGVSAIGIGDLDNDNKLEVIYGAGLTSSGKDLLAVFEPSTNATEYSKTDEGGPHSVHALIDIDEDGSEEIVFTTSEANSGQRGARLAILDAETGVELRGIDNAAGSFDGVGVHVRFENMDADPALEMVVARDWLVVYDGVTLEQQWMSFDNGGTVLAFELAELTGDGIPDIVCAVAGLLRIIDGATGQLVWSTESLGQSNEMKLAVGNVDADSAPEAILVVNGSAYVVDTQTRLVQLSYPAVPAVEIAIEGAGETCRIVHYEAGQVSRHNCETGAVESIRPLILNNASMIQPVTDSYGTLAVSDGERVSLQRGDREVGLPVSGVGPMFGWSNKAALAADGGRITLFGGSRIAVYRLEVDGELVFSSGFGD